MTTYFKDFNTKPRVRTFIQIELLIVKEMLHVLKWVNIAVICTYSPKICTHGTFDT